MKKIAYLTLLLIDMYAAFSTYDSVTAVKCVAVMIAAIAVNILFDYMNSKKTTY